MNSTISRARRSPALWKLTILSGVLACAALVQASNPASGSISLVSGPATWIGTASGTTPPPDPLNGDSGCTEGDNCDTYTLNVSGNPSDWAGKVIHLRLSWQLPVNDYDLYVRKVQNGSVLVSSGGTATTLEEAIIDPSATGTGTYYVRAVYYLNPNKTDQYHGSATVEDAPISNERQALHIMGGMKFSPSTSCRCPQTVRDGEPSSRCDIFGNYYVAGIRGVPAGVDLWYFDLRPNSPTFDPYMRNPLYRGQPDSFTPDQSTSVGADGGGDVDLAVGFGNGTSGFPTIAFSSLTVANLSVSKSTDRGITWQKNPAGNITGGVPVDDRQWMEFYGTDQVYMIYRTFQPAITQIQRSTDGGFTWGVARTAGQIGQVGGVDVDQHDGTVYLSGSDGKVAVGTPLIAGQEPLTYTVYQVASDPSGVAHLFFLVKVADDGTVYACYSNGRNIYLKHSTNKGQTWSDPVRVSDGPETTTSLLPAMETGPDPGSVVISWYGCASQSNDDDSRWKVFFAMTNNATSQEPTFRQTTVTDHYIHGSNISEGGTLGNANRNLLDYFQVTIDPQGSVVIGYTDDHNDYDGATYVTRLIDGPNVRGGRVPVPVEGANLPPRSKPNAEILDFAQDVSVGLVGTLPQNDPVDILSVKFDTKDASDGPMILATMQVSDLATIPNAATWRVNFSANAPDNRLSPTRVFGFGIADDADQFYISAVTSATGTLSFKYGTTVRNSDGSLTNTERGTADGGWIDQTAKTITIAVKASKLNPFVTHGPTITYGTLLQGLRAAASSGAGVALKSDDSNGGTQYRVTPKRTPIGQ